MDDMVLIGFIIGTAVSLGWMWWEFKQAPLVDDEDYEDWNGR